MLTKWLFVMMLDGKAEIIAQSATEALCKQAMVRITAVRHEQGLKTEGACYIFVNE